MCDEEDRQGSEGEPKRIDTDFLDFITLIFNKYAQGSTGHENLTAALDRINGLHGESCRDATFLLLSTLNEARLAYPVGQNFFPNKRYSCMTGLSERLLDMWSTVIVEPPRDPTWEEQYFNSASSELSHYQQDHMFRVFFDVVANNELASKTSLTGLRMRANELALHLKD